MTCSARLGRNRNLGISGGGDESCLDVITDVFSGATEKVKILVTHFQIACSFVSLCQTNSVSLPRPFALLTPGLHPAEIHA